MTDPTAPTQPPEPPEPPEAEPAPGNGSDPDLAPAPEFEFESETGAESRRPSASLTFGLAFVLGLMAALLLGVGALYAYDRQFSGRILPGVHVGSVDLSGLDADEARAALQGLVALCRGGQYR